MSKLRLSLLSCLVQKVSYSSNSHFRFVSYLWEFLDFSFFSHLYKAQQVLRRSGQGQRNVFMGNATKDVLHQF